MAPQPQFESPFIVRMQDQVVVMRDGTKIYCDIYRPEGDGRYPTIVSWSWFGKRPGDGMSE
jgi:predicted acyl esterase